MATNLLSQRDLMTERDLGTLGEAVLQQWCAEVGIIANRVQNDKSGWDYLLEFPLATRQLDEIPLDKAPSPVQTLVQVKSSDALGQGISVKLSNWYRLVMSPLPAFYLVLEFEHGSSCKRAFLVPVNDYWIRRILKRLREIGALKKRKPLSKASTTLRWAIEDRLESPGGVALKTAIGRHIGESFENAVTRKKNLVAGLGYENGAVTIEAKVVFDPGAGRSREQTLVDFALGVLPELQITSGAKLWDTRFGIRHPIPKEFSQPGLLRFEPKETGVIRFQSLRGGGEVELPVTVFSTGAVASLIREEVHQVRLHSQFVDLFLRGQSWELVFSLKQHAQRDRIDNLIKLGNLISLIGSARESSQLTFDVATEKRRFGGRLTFSRDAPADLYKVGESICIAWRLVAWFELPLSSSVSLDELWDHADRSLALGSVFEGVPDPIRIELTASSTEPITRAVCVPVFLSSWIGDAGIGAVAAFTGTMRHIGAAGDGQHRYQFRPSQVSLEKTFAFKRGDRNMGSIHMVLAETANKYTATHQVIRLW
jgi:hypothetical protein